MRGFAFAQISNPWYRAIEHADVPSLLNKVSSEKRETTEDYLLWFARTYVRMKMDIDNNDIIEKKFIDSFYEKEQHTVYPYLKDAIEWVHDLVEKNICTGPEWKKEQFKNNQYMNPLILKRERLAFLKGWLSHYQDK